METLFQTHKPSIQSLGLYATVSFGKFDALLFWNSIQEILRFKKIPYGPLLAAMIEVCTVATILSKSKTELAQTAFVKVTEQNWIGALALSEKDWKGRLQNLKEGKAGEILQKHIVTNASSSDFAIVVVQEKGNFPVYLVPKQFYFLGGHFLSMPQELQGFEHTSLQLPFSDLKPENRFEITYHMGMEVREKEIFGISSFLLGLALERDWVSVKQGGDWKQKQCDNFYSSPFRRRKKMHQWILDFTESLELRERLIKNPELAKVFLFLKTLAT